MLDREVSSHKYLSKQQHWPNTSRLHPRQTGQDIFLASWALPTLFRYRHPDRTHLAISFTTYLLLTITFQQVIRRCYSTLIPSKSSFLTTHLTPADLYGPFWTLTTLIFCLFVFSSLASSISIYLSDPEASSPTDPLEYNFGLLSIAAGLVYSYGLAIPILLWLGLRYLGVGEWSVVETVALWGYGQFVWIPVSVSQDFRSQVVRTSSVDLVTMRYTLLCGKVDACRSWLRSLRILPHIQHISCPRHCTFLHS